MKKILLTLFFLSFTCFSFADSAVKWGYEGNIGPTNWGDLSKEFAVCKTGQMQAPIDIISKQAAKVSAPIKITYKASAGEIINNGHTIQVNLTDGGFARLNGTDFKILQFHMHTPAEEKIDGKSFPFNAHLVHKSEDGKLAVIGILFNLGEENSALKEIFKNMPVKEGRKPLQTNFNIATLLPDSLAYYSYSGSLTTPGCSEGVQFFILKKPVELSSTQLDSFRKIFPMNARPVMPLNNRKIVESN